LKKNNNNSKKVILITGTSKGIGNFLAKYYLEQDYIVIGCSRKKLNLRHKNYTHFILNINDEKNVIKMFNAIRTNFGRLDILINNAGIASMNHSLLTTMQTVSNILETNVAATFLFCRESSKIMRRNNFGRIINFTTVATPLNLEGESIYASSKAAVITLTKILAKELADFSITVNSIGPTPIKTDLIKSVPNKKIKSLIDKQAIKRFGTFEDIANVLNFYLSKNSDFITGQNIYLGGV
jgi:3-oxoacyl-[acyl-carrier protein] reductase